MQPAPAGKAQAVAAVAKAGRVGRDEADATAIVRVTVCDCWSGISLPRNRGPAGVQKPFADGFSRRRLLCMILRIVVGAHQFDEAPGDVPLRDEFQYLFPTGTFQCAEKHAVYLDRGISGIDRCIDTGDDFGQPVMTGQFGETFTIERVDADIYRVDPRLAPFGRPFGEAVAIGRHRDAPDRFDAG